MIVLGDPVGTGLVDSLAQLGRNVTGMSMMVPEVAAKRLGLLKEVRIAERMVPKTMTLPSERTHIRAHNLRRAGRGGAQCVRRMHVWLRQWKSSFDNSQTRPQAIDRAFPVLPAYRD